MRYTTIIDIRDLPSLYRSTSVRLLYLHLCLKAGYHDTDRDIIRASIRGLAEETGLTVSAVRCALDALVKSRMIARGDGVIRVRKWIQEQTISPRAKTEQQQRQITAEAERRREKEAYERQLAIEAERREQMRLQGKDSYMIYYEDKLEKAAAGDEEARTWCNAHREDYERHRAAISAN